MNFVTLLSSSKEAGVKARTTAESKYDGAVGRRLMACATRMRKIGGEMGAWGNPRTVSTSLGSM
jgi:hypothetical protein